MMIHDGHGTEELQRLYGEEALNMQLGNIFVRIIIQQKQASIGFFWVNMYW